MKDPTAWQLRECAGIEIFTAVDQDRRDDGSSAMMKVSRLRSRSEDVISADEYHAPTL